MWLSDCVSFFTLVGDVLARTGPRSLGLLATSAGAVLLLGLSDLVPMPLPLGKARTLCGELLSGGGNDGRLRLACVRWVGSAGPALGVVRESSESSEVGKD